MTSVFLAPFGEPERDHRASCLRPRRTGTRSAPPAAPPAPRVTWT